MWVSWNSGPRAVGSAVNLRMPILFTQKKYNKL